MGEVESSVPPASVDDTEDADADAYADDESGAGDADDADDAAEPPRHLCTMPIFTTRAKSRITLDSGMFSVYSFRPSTNTTVATAMSTEGRPNAWK